MQAFGPGPMMLSSARGASPAFVTSAARSSLPLHASKANFASAQLTLRKRSTPKNLGLEVGVVGLLLYVPERALAHTHDRMAREIRHTWRHSTHISPSQSKHMSTLHM